jgi:hypothetical protein
VKEEHGSFTPKYLRDLNTQAEKAFIFVFILSTIEPRIEKVYNKIALVRLAQDSFSAVTN